ncbi:hypothetical protein DFH07DRAFT_763757 [Mycena maculata]|uniref:CCHC-type domain-containing protein n=1 Tax=Mycena maculata TaxID=230809 RepID=A0AAD7KI07_9AGAR|nr:hypothetical protein DFH07DRAFT_763757 [Mycena maculata]
MDILLMNLQPLWSGVRTSITSNKDEQKLILNGSTVDPPVKDEDDETLLGAMAAGHARFGSGGRRGGAGGGNGYSGGGSSVHARGGRYGGGSGNHPTDEKGHHWCDPTNENHCHRCGQSGHIAARCIHNMPQHIKDWVMGNPSHERSHAAAESAQHVHTYDDVGTDSEDDEYRPQYSNGIQVPLRI